ncbi:MAG: EF-hand domain-containing protein [Marivita sp.]|uniref:EF-hand domain-containing protein n=1 Tax=Marivita sp. TaxID=2003365 RepID=UPI003EF17DBF
MKTHTTILASFLLLTAPAFAQMVDVDMNEDGMVSFEELVAVYKTVTEEQFAEMDTNSDGRTC